MSSLSYSDFRLDLGEGRLCLEGVGCGCCAYDTTTTDPQEAIANLEEFIRELREMIASAGQTIKVIKETGRIPSGD